MTKSISVAVIVGSLRKESFTRRVAIAAMAHAPKALQCRFVEIGDLPHYNQDLDSKPPAERERFRAEIKKSDAVLFFTPEYNRSFPGHLKNAIDIASRPHGGDLWDGMPAGVVSVTPLLKRRHGCQPRTAPNLRVPQHARHAAARGLHQQRRRFGRRRGQSHKRENRQDFDGLHGCICQMGRHCSRRCLISPTVIRFRPSYIPLPSKLER